MTRSNFWMTVPLYIAIQCTQNGSIMFCPWKEQLQVLLQQSYYSSGYWRNVGFQSIIKLWIVHFEEIWENRNLHMKQALKTLFIYCAYLQWSQYNSITLFMSIEASLFNFVWMTCNSIADVDSSAVYKQNFGNPKQVLLIAFLLIEGM